MVRSSYMLTKVWFFLAIALLTALSAARLNAQEIVVKPTGAQGAYWLVSPKPWFTRLLVLSKRNRELEKDDHDDSLPTLPGYYHRLREGDDFVRYALVSVSIRKGKSTFISKAVKGQYFVFRGIWGTEDDESSGIDDVPYLKGTLFTYRNGVLVKKEKVNFSHAVNA